MQLIAHRGGSFGKENSLETMLSAARSGADAVECDIRKTKDGVLVIFHDDTLTRLAGNSLKVSDVTAEQMQKFLEDNGQKLLTFEELKNGYNEETPILLHIKLTDFDEEFAQYVSNSGLPIIAGVMSIPMLQSFAKFLPSDRILAFLPNESNAEEFNRCGAGIIRLWEQWLTRVTPNDIKKICPNAKVFIMACDLKREPYNEMLLSTMDGSIESLEKCLKLGADGVLLNNIDMALNWRKNINGFE